MGCGRVGSTLALRLLREGHEVAIIDLNLASFNRLGENFAGKMVLGSGLDEETLRLAGIEHAEAFASVTNGDNRNLMAAQIAKEVFKVSRVITRLYDPIRAQVYRELGLETFCSTSIGMAIIADFFATGSNRGPALESAAATPTGAS